MIVERIIFNVLAFALFVIIFLKMINKNDTNYTYVLVTQAIGIAIGFLGLIFRINLPVIIIMITYVISIILPLAVIIFEKKGLYLSEIININISRFYMKKGDIDKAKQILTDTIDRFPNSYYLHKELAAFYETNGENQIAVDEYMRASEINLADYDLKIRTANLLKTQKRDQDAKIMLENILKTKPDCYEASLLLSDILYERENFKDAITICLQALNYNPDQYDLYYTLGMLFTAVNDFQSAKEYYEKAAQLNSQLYHAKFNLGQISLLYNDIDEAEKLFTECVNDEDIADEVYYYLSYISMFKGAKEEAIQYLNIAVEENEELYDKAYKEPVFRVIISKINRPTNTAKERKNLTQKEKNTMKHLEETCAVVGNLNHNDIKVLRTIREKEEREKEQEQEKDKEQKSNETKTKDKDRQL